MPYNHEWVPPEIFLSRKGVDVYHAYKDDDVSNGALTYWYTLYPDEDGKDFDVRELPTWAKAKGKPPTTLGESEIERVKDALRKAIDKKILKAP